MDYLEMEPEQPKIRKRTISLLIGWIILIISVLLLILRNLVELRGFDTAYASGAIIGTLLIPTVILFLIFRSKSVDTRANGLLILAFLMLMSSIGNYVTLGNKISRENAIKEALNNMISSAVNGERVNEVYSSKDYGKDSEMLGATSKFLNRIIEVRINYLKKLDEVNNNQLAVQDYVSKPKLEAYLKKLKEVKQSLNVFSESKAQMYDKMSQILNGSSLSKSYKESALKGFESALKEDRFNIQEGLDLQNNYIDSNIEVIEFLLEVNSRVKLVNGSFDFRNQSDIDQFNKLISKVQDLEEKQSKWTAEYTKEVNNYKNNLKIH